MQIKSSNGYSLGIRSKSHMAEFSVNPDDRKKSEVSVEKHKKKIHEKEDENRKHIVSINKRRIGNGLEPFSNSEKFEEIINDSDLEEPDLTNYLIAYDINDLSTTIPGKNKNIVIPGMTIIKKKKDENEKKILKNNYSPKQIKALTSQIEEKIGKIKIHEVKNRKELPHEYWLRKVKILLENKIIDENKSKEILQIEYDLIEAYKNYQEAIKHKIHIKKMKKQKKKNRGKPKEKVYIGVQSMNSVLSIKTYKNRR